MAKTPKSKCAHPRQARFYFNASPGADMTGYSCSDCETTGLPAPVAPVVLAPGIYTLNVEVANAGKDRRSTDWNKLGFFPTGTYFVSPNTWDRNGDGSEWAPFGCRIKRHSGGYQRVEPNDAGYDALAASLVPVEGTTEEFVDSLPETSGESYCGSPDVVLAQLIDSGKITRADVVAAMAVIREREYGTQ